MELENFEATEIQKKDLAEKLVKTIYRLLKNKKHDTASRLNAIFFLFGGKSVLTNNLVLVFIRALIRLNKKLTIFVAQGDKTYNRAEKEYLKKNKKNTKENQLIYPPKKNNYPDAKVSLGLEKKEKIVKMKKSKEKKTKGITPRTIISIEKQTLIKIMFIR